MWTRASTQLLDERQLIAVDLVEQRADARRAGRQPRPRDVDERDLRWHDRRAGVDRVGRAERAHGDHRVAEVARGLRGADAAAEVELTRGRQVGEPVDALDRHGPDPQPVAQRCPHAGRGGEQGTEGDEDRQRDGERGQHAARQPDARRAPDRPRLGDDPRLHRGGDVRRRRPGDVVGQSEQLAIEVGQGAITPSVPTRSRRRASARDVRDFTVPRRQSRAAAVSSSERSSR